MVVDPVERGGRVLEAGGKRVLRGEAVVDADDGGARTVGEDTADAVVRRDATGDPGPAVQPHDHAARSGRRAVGAHGDGAAWTRYFVVLGGDVSGTAQPGEDRVEGGPPHLDLGEGVGRRDHTGQLLEDPPELRVEARRRPVGVGHRGSVADRSEALAKSISHGHTRSMSDPVLPPRPATTLEVSPSDDDVAFFAENGYLVVERLTTDEELDWLTGSTTTSSTRRTPTEPGAPVDRATATARRPLLSQAFMPEFRFPELLADHVHPQRPRATPRRCSRSTPTDSARWGHMIRKLPGGREAPWHQDEAYWEPELEYHALGCWLPMHEVTVEMGAMQFVPGSHRHGVFPHHPLDGDVELHLLVADVVDPLAEPVACPLPGRGDVPPQRTLHYTAPNLPTGRGWPSRSSSRSRRVTREVPAHRPWVDECRAASGWGAPTAYLADGVMVPI